MQSPKKLEIREKYIVKLAIFKTNSFFPYLKLFSLFFLGKASRFSKSQSFSKDTSLSLSIYIVFFYLNSEVENILFDFILKLSFSTFQQSRFTQKPTKKLKLQKKCKIKD